MFYCLNIRKKEIDAAKIVIIWELGKLGFRGQGAGGLYNIIHNQLTTIAINCLLRQTMRLSEKVFLEGAFAKRPYITYSKSD